MNLNPDSIMVHIVLQGLTDKNFITKILEHWEGLTMQKLETIVKAQETILTCTNGGKLGISANASDISDRQEIKCYKCGKKGHIRPKCEAKSLSCNKCHSKSHSTNVCRFNKPDKEPAKRDNKVALVRRYNLQLCF